jgi:polar amino acid transport system permease protein
MMTDFTFSDILLNLLQAAQWTIYLSFIAFIGGGIVAAGFLLIRMQPWTKTQRIVNVLVRLMQGTPLLILLFMGFFGLPLLGIHASAWMTASIILTLYTASFLVDIWHGTIISISTGQWAAAASLGLTRSQQFFEVVMPQALKIAIPPTVGFLVQVIKNTSLTSIIGFVELSRTAAILNNITFEPFPIYISVTVIYFLLCFPITSYSRWLEKRMNKHH